MDKAKFKLYSYVHKKEGYRYPGMVVSVFTTRAGKVRYVVEAFDPNFEGMLHIFSEEQLVSTNEERLKEITRITFKTWATFEDEEY